MIVGDYTLANEDKVRRIVEGTTDASGGFVEGLGEDADPAALLAAYDKIGGLIRGAEGAVIKTGSFYDFKAKAPRKKPEVVYVFRINGRVVEIAEGEKLPLEVQAAQQGASESVDDTEDTKPKRKPRARK